VKKLGFSLSELAKAAGVGESTLRKKIAAGEGPAITKFGRRSLILVPDARAWLASLRDRVAA
jgi:hypothetical protein